MESVSVQPLPVIRQTGSKSPSMSIGRCRMDESPFFVGGMWDVWHQKEEDRLYTFTVLTTFPNEMSAQVHDRWQLAEDVVVTVFAA